MLEFIRQAPFVRIVIPFVTGIILRLYFSIPTSFIAFFILLTLIFVIGSVILNKIYKNLNNQWLFGLLVTTSLIISGVISMSIRLNSMQYRIENNTQKLSILCTITDLPETKEKTVRCKANIEKIFDNEDTKIINQGFVPFPHSILTRGSF